MSSSTVTYTSVYTDSEPVRVFWGADKEPSLMRAPPHDHVPEPEYPEYLAPSDAEAPLEDQPLPVDALHTALSPGYVVDSGPALPIKIMMTNNDDDTDDEDKEPFEDEDDNEEEEEHLALVDSSAILIVDPVPSTGG
ncbi:hypothetical protein Tco_0489512 [Tanacetum coccineum]